MKKNDKGSKSFFYLYLFSLTVSNGDPALIMGSSDINPRSSIAFKVFAEPNLKKNCLIFPILQKKKYIFNDIYLSRRISLRLSKKMDSFWLVMWHMYCFHVSSGPFSCKTGVL